MSKIPVIRALPKLFVVQCNNSKRRKPGTPAKEIIAEGVQFSSGHVYLDTLEMKPGYRALWELERVLEHWGEYQIEWLCGDGREKENDAEAAIGELPTD